MYVLGVVLEVMHDLPNIPGPPDHLAMQTCFLLHVIGYSCTFTQAHEVTGCKLYGPTPFLASLLLALTLDHLGYNLLIYTKYVSELKKILHPLANY